MSNPYESPSSGFGGGDFQQAESKVKVPAMTLLIVTAISMALHVVIILLKLLGAGAGAAEGVEEAMQAMISGPMGAVFGVIALVRDGFIIFGMMKMMKLQSYGLALTACIMSMIPCTSPCCLIGIPIGIWGIVVLNDPLVKGSFR